MLPRFIGLKEFRQNMAKVSADAFKQGRRLIILRKNRPLFELRPFSEKEEVFEKLLLEIQEAKEDIKKKQVYSLKQVKKRIGLS
ncbi:MAG: hypothetical protein UU48_C0013G0011 [Candidatus Uhrbacteria bacterium GW2011_GWF2_41_16]|jgi:hypothetical protein|uniref:Antitoxin n=2 Tax=Candidatus Uhriibacteriota TaxID=1752732 RepID=A0A0G0VD01_9BACT|nr:MAG: hypothetical protein UU35_C0012G0011 [Candidatus Uhrbacteria bacterium GW2011_GWC2_41_11]KKR97521.1 MAG: hypothetical protein UU48_C0013G0011 [Candidatus Uhrbacteria bacterium GW2011_GWF2_41_16]HBP00022.1 hypothetical protein [Candidatus Uhrbacteria bacterium]